MAARVLQKSVDLTLRAMVSKKKCTHGVHRKTCTENVHRNTADFSQPAYNELHPSTGKAPLETASGGRDVSEMLVVDEL